jgi:hypothetical protein
MKRHAILTAIALTAALSVAPSTTTGVGAAPAGLPPAGQPNDVVGAIFEGLQRSGRVPAGSLELIDDQYRFRAGDASMPDIEFMIDVVDPGPVQPRDVFGFFDTEPGQSIDLAPNGAWIEITDGPGGQFFPGDLRPLVEVDANDLISADIGHLPRMIEIPGVGEIDVVDTLFGNPGPVLRDPSPALVVAPGTTPDAFGDELIFFDLTRAGPPGPGEFCEGGVFGSTLNNPDGLLFDATVDGDLFDLTSNQQVVQNQNGDVFASSLEYANGGFPESGVPMINVVTGDHIFGLMNPGDFPSTGPMTRFGVFCSTDDGGAVDVIELLPGPASLHESLPEFLFTSVAPPPTTTTSTTSTTSSTTTTSEPAPVVTDAVAVVEDPPAPTPSVVTTDPGGTSTASLILFGAIALFGLAGIGYGVYLLSKKGGPCDELIDAWAKAQKDCADKAQAAEDAQAKVDAAQAEVDKLSEEYPPLGFEDSGSTFQDGDVTIDSIDSQLGRWWRSTHADAETATGPSTSEDATAVANEARAEWAAERARLREEYESNRAINQQLLDKLEGAEEARDAADRAAKEACDKAEAARRAMQICLKEHESPPVVSGPAGGPSIATDPEEGGPCKPGDTRPREVVLPSFSQPRTVVDVSIIVETDVGHGDPHAAQTISQGFGDISTIADIASKILSGQGASSSTFKGNYGAAGAQVAGTHEDLPSIPTSLPQLGAEYLKFTAGAISTIATSAGRWAEGNTSYKIRRVEFYRTLQARRERVWECVNGEWKCHLEVTVEWGPIQRTSRYVGGIILGKDVERAAQRWLNVGRNTVKNNLDRFTTWMSQNPPGACD